MILLSSILHPHVLLWSDCTLDYEHGHIVGLRRAGNKLVDQLRDRLHQHLGRLAGMRLNRLDQSPIAVWLARLVHRLGDSIAEAHQQFARRQRQKISLIIRIRG